MKERPILFSAAMVRAIIDGMKTETRRVIREQPRPGPDASSQYAAVAYGGGNNVPRYCPYGVPGDLLWVRETWRESWASSNYSKPETHKTGIEYRATWNGCRDIGARTVRTDHARYGGDIGKGGGVRWRPSIFMPRWASRLTLGIEHVRVERLQDITETAAISEGVCNAYHPDFHRGEFRDLWDSINLKRGFGWDSNPWVWVIQFKRLEAKP